MAKTATTSEIDAKAAAQRARAYLIAVLPGVDGIRLEEIEMTTDDQCWLITLSFDVFPEPKQYKVFKVNAKTGDVVSMKIREM